MVRITRIYIKMIRFTEGKVLTTNPGSGKRFVFRQPAQFSQLLHLYHHLDPTLHSQIACRVCSCCSCLVRTWDPPPCPWLSAGLRRAGRRLHYLEDEIHQVQSSVCEWKMGLCPAVCLNPLTRGKAKLSLWFFCGWCLIKSLKHHYRTFEVFNW